MQSFAGLRILELPYVQRNLITHTHTHTNWTLMTYNEIKIIIILYFLLCVVMIILWILRRELI